MQSSDKQTSEKDESIAVLVSLDPETKFDDIDIFVADITNN